ARAARGRRLPAAERAAHERRHRGGEPRRGRDARRADGEEGVMRRTLRSAPLPPRTLRAAGRDRGWGAALRAAPSSAPPSPTLTLPAASRGEATLRACGESRVQ